jgi:hypothetical protein
MATYYDAKKLEALGFGEAGPFTEIEMTAEDVRKQADYTSRNGNPKPVAELVAEIETTRVRRDKVSA